MALSFIPAGREPCEIIRGRHNRPSWVARPGYRSGRCGWLTQRIRIGRQRTRALGRFPDGELVAQFKAFQTRQSAERLTRMAGTCSATSWVRVRGWCQPPAGLIGRMLP